MTSTVLDINYRTRAIEKKAILRKMFGHLVDLPEVDVSDLDYPAWNVARILDLNMAEPLFRLFRYNFTNAVHSDIFIFSYEADTIKDLCAESVHMAILAVPSFTGLLMPGSSFRIDSTGNACHDLWATTALWLAGRPGATWYVAGPGKTGKSVVSIHVPNWYKGNGYIWRFYNDTSGVSS